MGRIEESMREKKSCSPACMPTTAPLTQYSIGRLLHVMAPYRFSADETNEMTERCIAFVWETVQISSVEVDAALILSRGSCLPSWMGDLPISVLFVSEQPPTSCSVRTSGRNRTRTSSSSNRFIQMDDRVVQFVYCQMIHSDGDPTGNIYAHWPLTVFRGRH
jgi:hypothetical protein